MSNIQGHLRCDEPAHYLPPAASSSGNYLTDCAINYAGPLYTGGSVINAYCPAANAGGNMIASEVQYNGSFSQWSDHNSVAYDANGQMYLGTPVPGFSDRSPNIPGSYSESGKLCTNIIWAPTGGANPYDGTLVASCPDDNGNMVQNSINPADVCYPGSSLSNFHGYLQCDIPAKSAPVSNWQQLCGNASLEKDPLGSGGYDYIYKMYCMNRATSPQMSPTRLETIITPSTNSDLNYYYIMVQADGSLTSGPMPLPVQIAP